MVAERFLNRRWEEGKREGLAEGKREGRAQGKREGRAQGEIEGRLSQQEKWEDWNRRRMRAESRHEPFSEEPPSL